MSLSATDFQVAEREGFEPPLVLPKPVFKTGAINRSAISPGAKLDKQVNFQKVFSAKAIYFLTLC